MARVNGKSYNLIADPVAGQMDAEQVAVVVGATRTELQYSLQPADGTNESGALANIQINMTFTSALIPSDIQAYMDPVVYVTFHATNMGSQAADVEVMFGVTGELLVSQPAPETGVTPGPHATGARESACNDTDWDVSFQETEVQAGAWAGGASNELLRAARIGHARQNPLCSLGDLTKGNWGWQYLVPVTSESTKTSSAAPGDVSICTGCGLRTSAEAFVTLGDVGNTTDLENPRPFNQGLNREPAVLVSAKLG